MMYSIEDVVQLKVQVSSISIKRNNHVFKQALAALALCLSALSIGATLGISALMLPELSKETHMGIDEKYHSWIASVAPLTMIFGCVTAGALQDVFGRKLVLMCLNIPFLLGWILLGLSWNTETLILARILTGFCSGALRPTGMVFLGEITQPKYRGITLFSQATGANIGILLNHLLGYGFAWRNNAFMACLPLIFSSICLLFLRESPLWLISKGKIDQGIKNFYWYRGGSEISQRELNAALDKHSKGPPMPNAREMLILAFSKAFWMPFSTVTLLFSVAYYSGVNAMSFYAQDILKRTFGGDVNSFLLMIITDVVRTSSTVSMFVFGKCIPRRKAFFCSSFGTITLLMVLILLLHFESTDLLWASVASLILYMGTAGTLPSLSWSFVAELFPTNLRGIGSGAGAAMSSFLLFTTVQISPIIMDTLGIKAMYGIFASVTCICAVLLCCLLPDTNGKTLQEIEDNYNHDNDKNIEAPVFKL